MPLCCHITTSLHLLTPLHYGCYFTLNSTQSRLYKSAATDSIDIFWEIWTQQQALPHRYTAICIHLADDSLAVRKLNRIDIHTLKK